MFLVFSVERDVFEMCAYFPPLFFFFLLLLPPLLLPLPPPSPHYLPALHPSLPPPRALIPRLHHFQLPGGSGEAASRGSVFLKVSACPEPGVQEKLPKLCPNSKVRMQNTLSELKTSPPLPSPRRFGIRIAHHRPKTFLLDVVTRQVPVLPPPLSSHATNFPFLSNAGLTHNFALSHASTISAPCSTKYRLSFL